LLDYFVAVPLQVEEGGTPAGQDAEFEGVFDGVDRVFVPGRGEETDRRRRRREGKYMYKFFSSSAECVRR